MRSATLPRTARATPVRACVAITTRVQHLGMGERHQRVDGRTAEHVHADADAAQLRLLVLQVLECRRARNLGHRARGILE